MQYNNNPGERIMWEILADREYIREVEIDDLTTVPHTPDIPNLSHDDMETSDLNNTFFKHFFPETKGHAAIIDEYIFLTYHDFSRCPTIANRCKMEETGIYFSLKHDCRTTAIDDDKTPLRQNINKNNVKRQYRMSIAIRNSLSVSIGRCCVSTASSTIIFDETDVIIIFP
jgi:hypothetical protein